MHSLNLRFRPWNNRGHFTAIAGAVVDTVERYKQGNAIPAPQRSTGGACLDAQTLGEYGWRPLTRNASPGLVRGTGQTPSAWERLVPLLRGRAVSAMGVLEQARCGTRRYTHSGDPSGDDRSVVLLRLQVAYQMPLTIGRCVYRACRAPSMGTAQQAVILRVLLGMGYTCSNLDGRCLLAF